MGSVNNKGRVEISFKKSDWIILVEERKSGLFSWRWGGSLKMAWEVTDGIMDCGSTINVPPSSCVAVVREE